MKMIKLKKFDQKVDKIDQNENPNFNKNPNLKMKPQKNLQIAPKDEFNCIF